MMQDNNNGRYSRQTMLPEIGEEGQRRISEASVLIVGLGGLGAPVATYLTGAGVGRIGLADSDTVSLSNLQRQTLYDETCLGQPKTECAARRLSAMSSEIRLELYPEGLTETNAAELVKGFDLVVDCCDNFPTRFLIDDVCAETGRPWVHGTIGEFAGQVTVFNYRNKRRYSELYPYREGLCALERTVRGVIGAVPGAVGSIQAIEALKIITGAGEPLDGRLLLLDLLNATVDVIYF